MGWLETVQELGIWVCHELLVRVARTGLTTISRTHVRSGEWEQSHVHTDLVQDIEVEGRLYISVPYVYPPSSEACDTISLEQSEGSLVYPKGTKSSSIILICSIIFFLFPSFVGTLSFFCPFHSFLSKTTQILPFQEVHLISSPSLWTNRLGEGVEGLDFLVISGILGWWGNTQPCMHHGLAVKFSYWPVWICCLKIKFTCLGHFS